MRGPMTAFAAAGLVLALPLAACAPTTDAGAPGSRADTPQRCFNVDQVQNFRQGRTGQVFIRALGGGVFELNSAGGCTNLDFTHRLGIVPDGAGLAGGRVCVNDSVRIVTPGATSPADVCRARVMRSLTEVEIAALPARDRL